MAAARLEVGTGTQSRVVPDRLEASVFQVLSHLKPRIYLEDRRKWPRLKNHQFSSFFHQDYNRLLHRPTFYSISISSSKHCYETKWLRFSFLKHYFSMLFVEARLSRSPTCYSSKSRSKPSKCLSCIKTLLQASTGIQRSNRSAHTPQ